MVESSLSRTVGSRQGSDAIWSDRFLHHGSQQKGVRFDFHTKLFAVSSKLWLVVKVGIKVGVQSLSKAPP